MRTIPFNKSKSTLTVEEEKNEVAVKLLTLKNHDIVHSINLIVDELIASNAKKTSKQKYNNEINAAVKRVRNGKSISNDDVINEMEKW
jgi:hypothetical protein